MTRLRGSSLVWPYDYLSIRMKKIHTRVDLNGTNVNGMEQHGKFPWMTSRCIRIPSHEFKGHHHDYAWSFL